MDPLLPHSAAAHWLSSLIDSPRHFYFPGSLVLQEAFNSMSKFAGALVIWFASGSNSNIRHNLPGDNLGLHSSSSNALTQVKHISSVRHELMGFFWKSKYLGRSAIPLVFNKISSFAPKQISKEVEWLQSFPMLSLAAALIPPITNVSSNILAIPMETSSVEAQRCMDQKHPCDIESRRCGQCSDLYLQNLVWAKKIEPRTDVHPFDICERLGPKYACIPEYELNKHQEFYQDLLRVDINMSVRLVVSCNGIKINTVKDVFEKSLRARLTKTNPEADFSCLHEFGSLFSEDIPLHVGTAINFRRTADGHLITEVGGNNIGAVQSKDLCTGAFFDMYIGDIPICERTKEEIGKNVATIIRMC